jgi:hypothetical protein
MWGALIAIADQGRALAGKGSLDGATQTLPMLYSLYSAPGTSGYASYTSYFNDIVQTGSNKDNVATFGYGAPYTDLNPGPVVNSATPGYDTATGLGTPKVVALIGALAQNATTSTATPTPTPTPAPTPTVPQLELASPISTIAARGPKAIRLRFTWPRGMNTGNYYLVGSVNALLTHSQLSAPVSATTVSYAQPTVDLSASFGNSTSITVVPGGAAIAVVTIKNLGNVNAKGTIDLTLTGSNNPSVPLATLSGRGISLRPGHSETFRIRFTAPALDPGTYTITASLTSSTAIADTNLLNNVATIATVAKG